MSNDDQTSERTIEDLRTRLDIFLQQLDTDTQKIQEDDADHEDDPFGSPIASTPLTLTDSSANSSFADVNNASSSHSRLKTPAHVARQKLSSQSSSLSTGAHHHRVRPRHKENQHPGQQQQQHVTKLWTASSGSDSHTVAHISRKPTSIDTTDGKPHTLPSVSSSTSTSDKIVDVNAKKAVEPCKPPETEGHVVVKHDDSHKDDEQPPGSLKNTLFRRPADTSLSHRKPLQPKLNLSTSKPGVYTPMSAISAGLAPLNQSITQQQQQSFHQKSISINFDASVSMLDDSQLAPPADVSRSNVENKHNDRMTTPVFETQKADQSATMPQSKSFQAQALNNSQKQHETSKSTSALPPPDSSLYTCSSNQKQAAGNRTTAKIKSCDSRGATREAVPISTSISLQQQSATKVPDDKPATATKPQQSISATSRLGTRSFVVNGKEYHFLSTLGKGGSSVVYQVYDVEAERCLAIKAVDLSDADEKVKEAYENEIKLLERLQNTDRVVKLYDSELQPSDNKLFVVIEKGDTDFGTFLKGRRDDPLTMKMISFYWVEMLRAVKVIHDAGIVHSDLKPANFLLVGGNLKLIDFGIASTLPTNKTSITKDCQMGTLNYMSPEAITNASQPDDDGACRYKVQFKSDVWSLGCILYSMIYGCTPFQHIKHTFGKMMAITDPIKHPINFKPIDDPLLLDVVKKCLRRDVTMRPSVQELLEHPYVTQQRTAVQNDLATSPAPTVMNEQKLLDLAQQMNAQTPRTNAKMLKKLFAVKNDNL